MIKSYRNGDSRKTFHYLAAKDSHMLLVEEEAE